MKFAALTNMATVGETVYGTTEEGHVMSEKVSSLATNIYKEFERMIKKYDEDVVKELMPLTVGLLEGLDQALSEKQEAEVELELLRDDNEQLLTQYEREKQLRKASEQKYLEMEDAVEGEKKELTDKLESLESILRMLELKSKNSADHVSRMEEKEVELKKEYTKLHERYTELFRTHMDYMERTKILLGTDRIELSNSPRSKGFNLPNLRPVSMFVQGSGSTPVKTGSSPPSTNSFDMMSPRSGVDSNISLKSELSDLDSPDVTSKPEKKPHRTSTADKEQVTDNINVKESSTATKKGPIMSTPKGKNRNRVDSLDEPDFEEDKILGLDHTLAHIIATTPELQELEESMGSQSQSGSTGPKRNNESIFEELSSQDVADVDFGADITGMGRELENLILENTELLATKNALNIVKDDLIAKVDELTSEQEILREEINSLQTVKTKLQQRVKDLEDDLKKMKEELEKKNNAAKEEGDEVIYISSSHFIHVHVALVHCEVDDVPMAQRKRFTRVEMARVLMERNQYKERLMELQEAVRWTEMIRASREHPEISAPKTQKKGTIWNL
ncbi:hypothetical protein KUTeg_024072 [Tegillarca granosa]|uniref:Uncharacterized protein n=1 Tax=Tegillarca granosa TaxID=220873 RepID=A0ABQ9DZC6_TEGGR|nr:hypothetical protein KUTeg_024072 [Tegillarca granosa]